MSDYVEWGALASVALVGLVVGAGLPALFAVGVWALAGPGSVDDTGRRRTRRIAVAAVCFIAVIAAIITAIAFLASGGH